MNQLLFSRATGNLSPEAFSRTQTAKLIQSIQPYSGLRFKGPASQADPEAETGSAGAPSDPKIWAHQAGVNALAIDIDSRLLVSGGADSTIRLWDVQECSSGTKRDLVPIGEVARTSSTHKFGITHLSFYPFDSAAFLSSSYDHQLKLYATDTLTVSANFDLGSVVYNHALSPIASHLLVACATQHPAVRLVDLRSGSTTHSLAGHHGALISISWSPVLENILASGGIDGAVRLWDIRKSSGALGVLDMEDSVGMSGRDELGLGSRKRETGKAHSAAVNGITWTDDGAYLVSTGHDERIRVWDAATGANTLASFGPKIKNSHLSRLPLLISPGAYTAPGRQLLFYPNEHEILIFELHEGRLVKRLKVPGSNTATTRSRTGEMNVKNRITGLAWKGQADGFYSCHTDGQIRAWIPRDEEDSWVEQEERENAKRKIEDESDDGKRKRQVLDEVFRDLTRKAFHS